MCIVVVANKMDLVESGEKERKVPEKDIVDLCLRHSVTYKCASALTGLNVQESFEELV
jgi:GTPase SAR1 family protein